MGRRTHLPVWDEVRSNRKRGRASVARASLDRTIGTWVFWTHFAPGQKRVIVTDVCVVMGGDDHGVVLRGNGRTRRMSWETFADRWRPWQGEAMPRPVVLGSVLAWPSLHPAPSSEK